MSLTLHLDTQVMNEQISLLRGTLTNRRLNPRQRFLVINLINVLNSLARDHETVSHAS